MKEISENAKKLLIENIKKLPDSEKHANADGAGLKEILECFFIKDIISYIKRFGEIPDFIPYPQNKIVDFSKAETKLGFKIHPELKELYSLYYFPDIYGDTIHNSTICFNGVFPSTDIYENFNNSSRHFCTIGSEDIFSLEFNNDTGEIYLWDYEYNTYLKIAHSVRELLLKADSIWSVASEDELFPLEDLYEK
ncbi:MAG: hypothetical protein K2J40_10555 [Ruminococcus sp.]|nr:hypothetical protein [Ruminococcus sp.]